MTKEEALKDAEEGRKSGPIKSDLLAALSNHFRKTLSHSLEVSDLLSPKDNLHTAVVFSLLQDVYIDEKRGPVVDSIVISNCMVGNLTARTVLFSGLLQQLINKLGAKTVVLDLFVVLKHSGIDPIKILMEEGVIPNENEETESGSMPV